MYKTIQNGHIIITTTLRSSPNKIQFHTRCPTTTLNRFASRRQTYHNRARAFRVIEKTATGRDGWHLLLQSGLP